jgi:hypothetical protein
MALRLHRVTEEQWQRLAASRRKQEFTSPPDRTAIGAIEMELQSLDPTRGSGTD